MSLPKNGFAPNLKDCEIQLMDAEDRVELVEEAKKSLMRYGRAEGKLMLDGFCDFVGVQGEYLRNLPLGLVRADDPQAEKGFVSFMSGVSSYVDVNDGAEKISLKPVWIKFDGFDTSKRVSEVNPASFIVLPYSKDTDGVGPGKFIPNDSFEVWFKSLNNKD